MHSFKILLLLILSIFNISAQAQWLPFTLKNNHITIDIEFNGQPAKAMLDSGAEMNAVSTYYVEKYGEGIRKSGRINVKGVNGTSKTSLYSNVPVKIFGADITLDKLIGVNFSDTAILFGAPFFRSFIVQIDYPNSRMQFFPKKSVDMNKFKNVNVKRERGSLLPAIQVQVNKKNVWLTLDTGNNSGLYIKRSYALENQWLTDNHQVEQSAVMGVNGSAKTEVFTLSSLAIGPYDLEDVQVIIPAKGERTNIGRKARESLTGSKLVKGKQTKGLLGYDVLKHFVVTIDYSDYQVHIVAP